jgi:hypothetical protein
VSSIATDIPNPPRAAATPPPSATSSPVRALLRDPRFLAAAAVLLVSAAGFNAAAQYLQVHFRKQAVPLPVRALDDKVEGVPAKIAGRWLQVGDDQPLNADVEHALGTKQYVTRVYVDLKAKRAPSEAALVAARDAKDVGPLLEDLRRNSPEALIHAHVTYYTGLVDTVAHIPDRCMVADGYQPAGSERRDGPAAYADGKPRDLGFRFITFEDISGRSRVTRNVAYLFHVNGKYTDDPLGVRAELQKLWERYGYYAKIELMTESPGKADAAARERSAKAMGEFLADLVPEVERRLPDWQQVNAGGVAAK